MANEVNLNLDPRGFLGIVPERMAAFENAPATPLPSEYPVNRLARLLHPEWQYAKIIKVETHGPDAKSFTLVPDKEKGTEGFAYFSAGQYVCVYLAIGGSRLLRPYSIRSAPADALNGVYILTVKRVENGFASEYILDNWAEGGEAILTGPEGNFTYEPLRDQKHILGIAGGSGITPFYSMACSIADGTEDMRLTLLYGSRFAGNILLKEEFEAVAAKTDKVKIVYVLSDEQAPGFEYGFVTTELIRKYAPQDGYSIFLCGPQAMYKFMDEQLKALGLPAHLIRHELFGECKDPFAQPGYPGADGEKLSLIVVKRDERQAIPCSADESLLTALERAGIAIPSRCRGGDCAFCNTKLLDGEVFIPEAFDKRRLADVSSDYIHPCVTFPLGDTAIEIPYQRTP